MQEVSKLSGNDQTSNRWDVVEKEWSIQGEITGEPR